MYIVAAVSGATGAVLLLRPLGGPEALYPRRIAGTMLAVLGVILTAFATVLAIRFPPA